MQSGSFYFAEIELSLPLFSMAFNHTSLDHCIYIYISRHRNQKTVVTSFDKINMWLWLSLGMSIFILIMFGSYINFKINPIILLLAATPTFVSGVILKFKPLLVGGVVFWLSAIASYLMDYPSQFLISAFAIAVGFLIPGILIKRMFV